MSIAQELPEVHPFFIQKCPFCDRNNRMVVKGLYVLGSKVEQYPDMGYSFCNCRAIFYTRPENLTEPVGYIPDEQGNLSLPDPFFAWPNPYDFLHWNVRRYEIIWDMYSLCEYLMEQGYQVLSARRDFNLNSTTPQHYHIKVKK